MLPAEISNQLYLDHLVLVISDLARTREFYQKILGIPVSQNEYSIRYHVGETRLFFVLPYGDLPSGDKFNPNRIGLEHFALGVKTLDVLKQIEEVLNAGSIQHSGIHIDKHSGKEKIWLNDPDGIRLEFFIRA